GRDYCPASFHLIPRPIPICSTLPRFLNDRTIASACSPTALPDGAPLTALRGGDTHSPVLGGRVARSRAFRRCAAPEMSDGPGEEATAARSGAGNTERITLRCYAAVA